ncbi:MAG: UDP-N-acetylmuramate dehydrogenase [Candidatus Liptonbacteria bacterium]|nr:UDP-N-acetylmuramate dehydrogenase [Candidatus Liptonbacteria bacterium]
MSLVRENVPLKRFSNFRIGGAARYFVEVGAISQLRSAVRFAKQRKLPVFLLGGGTNLLIRDEGYPGLVLRITFPGVSVHGATLRAGAGATVAQLVAAAVRAGLMGLEWAGGLPGTVGGAIFGNAGAFGGEIKDSVSSVESFNLRTGKIIRRATDACQFSYRNSVFKERAGQEVILRAVFRLHPGKTRELRRIAAEKIAFRKARHPMEHPNIGSIFKNIPLARARASTRVTTEMLGRWPVKNDPFPVIPAAVLLAEAGLRGTVAGGAMISPKHPNFIVNVTGASARDVEALIALAKERIRENFGLELEEEVRRVG